MSRNALLMIVVVAGCSPSLKVGRAVPTFADASAPAPAPAFAKWSPPQQQTLEQALQATWDIVRTAAFQNRVASVNNLHEAVGGRQIAGAQVAALYVYARLPVTYVASDKDSETSDTGTYGDTATMNLNVDNLARWTDGTARLDDVKRSCLVNTLAHEWTHTLPGPDGAPRFQDESHKYSRYPLVSYTVGSIAQCVYLQARSRVPEGKFWSCVEKVGTNVFNGVGLCDSEAWLDRL